MTLLNPVVSIVLLVAQGTVNVVLGVLLVNAYSKIRKLFNMQVTASKIFSAHDRRIANIVDNLPADDGG